jgi:hypothetical protein
MPKKRAIFSGVLRIKKMKEITLMVLCIQLEQLGFARVLEGDFFTCQKNATSVKVQKSGKVKCEIHQADGPPSFPRFSFITG